MKKVALAIAAVAIALIGPRIRSANADSLYIGDVNDNTVKRFDARTGAYLGVFVTNNGCLNPNPNSPPPACLYGPRGLIFDGRGDFDGRGHLLVANQNVTLNVNGAINEYNHTGAFVKALVPDDSKGPPAPRGIILKGNNLFVASLLGYSFDETKPGLLQAFNGTTGAFRGLLAPSAGLASSFHPRGVVIGPDGLLYVSNDPVLGGTDGHVLRFDPATRNFKDIFVSNDVCICDFNRPEGLVFGPDGNLYVTSFAKLSSTGQQLTTDKILIFAGPYRRKPGAFLAKIDLDQVGQDRAFAQALLFGPGGRLFVPVSTPAGSYAGQVRRYKVNDLDNIRFEIFVPSNSMQTPPPGSVWFYLTFGNTDAATLNYMSPE
jgi:hypothetical protein